MNEEPSVVPHVSLSTVAKAMNALSPRALARLLAGHKYKKQGPIGSYAVARRQAVDRLVDGTPLAPDEARRAYERDAIAALERTKLVLAYARARRPRTFAPRWVMDGVVVSMQPDVELEAPGAEGAAKFAFAKDALMAEVGITMASLLWHWRANVLGRSETEKDLCVVVEPRVGKIHRATARVASRLVPDLYLACRTIGALWSEI